jgi:hypothetical protein
MIGDGMMSKKMKEQGNKKNDKVPLWDEDYIENFFKSIGIPIEDVSGRRDGTTSIIMLPRHSPKPEDKQEEHPDKEK